MDFFMLFPLLHGAVLATEGVCSDPIKMINSNDDRNHFAGKLTGIGHSITIKVKADRYFKMNLGGHVIRGPINLDDFHGGSPPERTYTRTIYGSKALIAIDVAGWSIVNGARPNIQWKDSYHEYDESWWYDTDAQVFNQPSIDFAEPIVAYCDEKQRAKDPACISHRYYRALIELEPSSELSDPVQMPSQGSPQPDSSGLWGGSVAGAVGLGAAAVFIYRRRTSMDRGEIESAQFNDSNNMNPLYEGQKQFENPLYAAPVEEGFDSSGRPEA